MGSASALMRLRGHRDSSSELRKTPGPASGTEPKIKYYCEVGGAPGVARAEVAAEVATMAEAVIEELLKPDKFGLR